ncbi:Ahc2p PWA37_004666 [Arxiozyma heterogenica]|uniref:Uncharacterized protein n=1 Tax=Arxiozyma heterogenica TaxID=278026 RepID=A0AAN7WSS3_9SACH|nr:hypothetical protein RI543_000948 [Kazachstania heterogenica]
MLTSTDTINTVKEFQEQDLIKNVDYKILKQQEGHLNKLIDRQDTFTKKLQILYERLDAVKNYEEFTDLLVNSSTLLREIFSLDNAQKKQPLLNQLAPSIDWSKYGLHNISNYIIEDDDLISLQNDGLL